MISRQKSILKLLSDFGDLWLALALIVVADIAFFHSRLYVPLLEPRSYSGRVERTSRRFNASFAADSESPRIVMIGNSMTGAAMEEALLDDLLAREDLDFYPINIAQGGSTPRSWYHLLKHENVSGKTTRLVVLGVHSWSVQVFSKPRPDLDIVKTRLTLSDAFSLPWSYSDLETRLSVFAGIFYRTPFFREDLQQYAFAPQQRHEQLKKFNAVEKARGPDWRPPSPSRRNLSSARLGQDGKLVLDELDPFLRNDAKLQADVEHNLRLLRSPPAALRTITADRHKVDLLARLVRMLNRRDVAVVFAIIPFTPYRHREFDHRVIYTLHEELRRDGAEVVLWHDPQLISKIESPEYYQDTMHVNEFGARLYTEGLVEFLTTYLQADDPPNARLRIGNTEKAQAPSGS